MKGVDNRVDVVIGSGVVVDKEPNGQGNTEVVVEETCEEGVCLVTVQ